MSDKAREAFEAWRKTQANYGEQYINDFAFKAYQAATEAARAEYLPVVEKPVEALGECREELVMLAKSPEDNPWVRQAYQALALAAPLLGGK